MIEHKLLTEELHQIIIRPNPPMPWGQLKKIYFIFTFFILFLFLDKNKLFAKISS